MRIKKFNNVFNVIKAKVDNLLLYDNEIDCFYKEWTLTHYIIGVRFKDNNKTFLYGFNLEYDALEMLYNLRNYYLKEQSNKD